MKAIARTRRRDQAHLVTEAQPPLSADIAARQRRYLIMMGVRVVCFAATIAMFAAGAGWLCLFPAIGAIAIPYFAVVLANGGREPASTRGFRAYEPQLPERWRPPAQFEAQNINTQGFDIPGSGAGQSAPQPSQPFSQEPDPEK